MPTEVSPCGYRLSQQEQLRAVHAQLATQGEELQRIKIELASEKFHKLEISLSSYSALVISSLNQREASPAGEGNSSSQFNKLQDYLHRCHYPWETRKTSWETKQQTSCQSSCRNKGTA